MQKITTLLCSALLAFGGAGAAEAQTVSSTPVNLTDGLTDGNFYVINAVSAQNNKSGLLYYDPSAGNSRYFRMDIDLTSVSEGSMPALNYVWQYKETGEDATFTLCNAMYGTYMVADPQKNQNMQSDETANLKLEKDENGWHVTMTNYQHNSGQDSSGSPENTYWYINQPQGDPNLSWWIGIDNSLTVDFYEVSGLSEVNYTYKVTDVGISFTKSAALPVGSPFNAPAVNFYTITEQPAGTVAEGVNNVTVNCTSAYPGGLVAKAMTDGAFADDARWYTLSVRNGQAVVATDNGIRTKGQSRQLAEGNMWTFVKEDGNPDGFKIYNLLKGAGSPLYVASAANSTDASFAAGSEEAGTSTFTITANGNGFNLQYPGNANANLGDHHNGALSVWNNGSSAGDVGSRFVIAEVNDLLPAMVTYTGSGYVGSFLNSDEAEQEKTAYTNFTNGINTTEALETLIGFDYDNAPKVQLTDGGYYRIRNCYTNGNPCLTADSELQSQDYDAANASQIWKLESAEGGKYRLTSQGVTGKELTGDDPKHMTTGPKDGETVLTFYIGENHAGDANGIDGLMWFLDTEHNAADNDNATALYGNGKGTVVIRPNLWGASAWYIVEATTLDFTVSEANYATANFDFPVRLDEGMTAYVAASQEENVITLTQIGNGEVPANTPVVIAAPAGTYTLDILTETPAAVEGNLLSGSLLPYDITETPAYIFGVDDEGTPTFYRVADDDNSLLGANKAYFAPQGSSATSRYVLRFGGEGTTGIQGVEAAGEAGSDTYYDLNGRRVLYPAKGLYVTGSGKKVFLK